MAKKRKNDMTIYLLQEEKECIKGVFKYLVSKSGIFYILKQVKECLEMEFARDFIKEYLIKQHNKDEKEHIKYKSVKIMLKCIGGKYSINEKRKSNLFGAIVQNDLWIQYINYIISVSGRYFIDIREFLYMLKCNPIKLCDTIECIFKNTYFHGYINESNIDISKNLSQRHILSYFEKNNLLESFLQYIIKNIEIFLPEKEKIEHRIQEISVSLQRNNIFSYKQNISQQFNFANPTFNMGQSTNFNYTMGIENRQKKKREELLSKKRRLSRFS